MQQKVWLIPPCPQMAKGAVQATYTKTLYEWTWRDRKEQAQGAVQFSCGPQTPQRRGQGGPEGAGGGVRVTFFRFWGAFLNSLFHS
jgi:hypothetical protein